MGIALDEKNLENHLVNDGSINNETVKNLFSVVFVVPQTCKKKCKTAVGLRKMLKSLQIKLRTRTIYYKN